MQQRLLRRRTRPVTGPLAERVSRRAVVVFVTLMALVLSSAPGLGDAQPSEPDGAVAVYLLLDQPGGGPFLVPVHRHTDGPADGEQALEAALELLLEGPTQAESASLPAVSTGIPGGTALLGVSIADGLATIDLTSEFEAGAGSFAMFTRLGQLVFTATQFSDVEGVALELEGETITVFSVEGIDVSPPVDRTFVEGAGVLPPILLEVPRYGGTFEARVSGSATVAEFSAQVFDGDGRLLGSVVVSAGEVDGRTVFDAMVPYVSITEQSGIVLVEDEDDRAASLREHPVTLVPTPVPAERGIDAACPTAEIPEPGFADVAPGNVHAAAIACIAWREITVGRTPTTYEPAGPITRGQMASMLTRALTVLGQELPEQPDSPFPDTSGTTHALAIDQLAELGIVLGRADGSYGPGVVVTRAQMATFLVRTFEHIAFDLEPDRDYFVDDDGSVHERSINAAALAGLTAGVDGDRFGPSNTLRRDQMATFVARLLDLGAPPLDD